MWTGKWWGFFFFLESVWGFDGMLLSAIARSGFLRAKRLDLFLVLMLAGYMLLVVALL